MMHEMPAAPPWMDDLPHDRRGFLVPAESAWIDGVPWLSRVPVDTKLALAVNRSCAVCGYHLEPGRPVYRAFSQADAAQIRLYERDVANDLHGPGHKSCILFSTFVCPYLREPGAKLMKDSVISPGARRGSRPAVMGFEDFGLMMYRNSHDPLDTERPEFMPRFAYRALIDDLRYRDPFELLEELRRAIRDDRDHIDQSQQRAYWTDSQDDEQLKATAVKRGLALLQASDPVGRALVHGLPFVVLELPPAGW